MSPIPTYYALPSFLSAGTIASVLLFTTLTSTYLSLFCRAWLNGDARLSLFSSLEKGGRLDVKSLESVYACLRECVSLGMVLLFAHLCENHPPFPHAEKSGDLDELFFLTGVFFLVGAFVFREDLRVEDDYDEDDGDEWSTEDGDLEEKGGLLNVDQRAEWKGWMSFCFLLIGYYDAKQLTNPSMVIVTCFLFIKSFEDFGCFLSQVNVPTLLRAIWSLNLGVAFLSFSQGTTYILYYVCPLATFNLLLCYFILRYGRPLNHTKWGMRWKMMYLAVAIDLLWDMNPGLFQLLHLFLGNAPTIGALHGTLCEWYSRTFAHHWSPFWGMIFAANYQITSLFFHRLDILPSRDMLLAKGMVGLGMAMAFYVWVKGPFLQPEYVQLHPYFGFIPLIAYLYFRNLTPKLRAHSFNMFHPLGAIFLETFLLQHHIWMTTNGETLLVLLPGWSRVNMIIVTSIFLLVSRHLHRVTLLLRDKLLPENDVRFCLYSLVGILGITLLLYGVALSLMAINLARLSIVGLLSIVCGSCLYQFIMDTTWRNFKESAPPLTTGPDSFLDHFMVNQSTHARQTHPSHQNLPESIIARFFPLILSSVAIVVVGMTWETCAKMGASNIAPLPPHCAKWANNGNWIPVSSCSAQDRAEAYRFSDVSMLACHPNYPLQVWGWTANDPNTHCRFAHRSPADLKKRLRNRTIVFVGDSITRNLYHATLRALGAQTDSHDATAARHSDAERTLEDGIHLEFRWAPLALDQLHLLLEYNSDSIKINLPHLLIQGGGAWDRLHLYATDEDKKSLEITIIELVKEFTILREKVPIVWSVPTAINTKALNTEQKRDHMKEEDIEEMRKLYSSLGIERASSFVLDGPSYTRECTSDSHDGVHYPPHIYDAGVQILANAMDWVLPEYNHPDTLSPPACGNYSSTALGFMMLGFLVCGLFLFDGFLGFSYLANLVTRGIMPSELYDEAIGDSRGGVQDDILEGEDSLRDVDDKIADLLSGGKNLNVPFFPAVSNTVNIR